MATDPSQLPSSSPPPLPVDELDELWLQSRLLIDRLNREVQDTANRRGEVLAEIKRIEQQRNVLFGELTLALQSAKTLRDELEQLRGNLAARRSSEVPATAADERGFEEAAAQAVEHMPANDEGTMLVPDLSAEPTAQSRGATSVPVEEARQYPALVSTRPRYVQGIIRLMAAALLLLLILVLSALLTPLPTLFGWHSYGVASTSMQPAIPVGATVFTQPVSITRLRPGDVITVADPEAPGVLVTHRIVSLDVHSGEASISTRGDANNTQDAWTVEANQPVDRVAFFVPLTGYLQLYLTTLLARVAMIVLAAGVMIAPWLWRRLRVSGTADGSRTVRTRHELSTEIEQLLSS